MIKLDPSAIPGTYDQAGRESLVNALEILQKHKFFDFLISENNRLLVEAYDDESEADLTKKILDNRQTNRILLSIPTLIPIIKEVNNA